jgi:threonine dehydrogenase-like Zn-dependent dehydrogenase
LATDYPKPTPQPGQVRIRTELVGICNTDLEILRGYADFSGVLGHEFVGFVEQAKNPELLGRRVVGEINLSCGMCQACIAGRPSHCSERIVLGIRGHDGALSEYVCLPVGNLHFVPEGISDRTAVFVEPLAAACQIVDQIHVRPTDRVVILGDGKLGLLVAQVLALTGCELTVVGRHSEKLDILAARGLHTRIGVEGLEATADLVIECTGQAEGFHTARRLVRPGATLVLKSTYLGQVQTDLSSLVVDEIQVVGSRCGPFPAALRLLDQGLVNVEPLIEAVYPLQEAQAAFEHASRRGALKILVRTGRN